jgi:hypothetical protein
MGFEPLDNIRKYYNINLQYFAGDIKLKYFISRPSLGNREYSIHALNLKQIAGKDMIYFLIVLTLFEG